MSHRVATMVVVIAGLAGPALRAEPIWTYSSPGTGGTNNYLYGTEATTVQGFADISPSGGGHVPGLSLGQYTQVFDLPLTITDVASGEGRTLEIPYSLLDGYSYIEADPDVFAAFTLGSNRYTITVPDINYPTSLQVEPVASVSTPEPATLGLAALGLATVAVGRWRSRSSRDRMCAAGTTTEHRS